MADKVKKDVDKGEGAFSVLMRTMSPDTLKTRIDKAEEDQIRNYKFKEGVQNVIVSGPPRIVRNLDRFSYSDGIGYVGTIREMRGEEIGNNEYPIIYTETQFWELVGQTKIHFPLWTPSIDLEFEVLSGIKLIATTQKFFDKDDTEKKTPKTKTRFEIDESHNSYKERTVWLNAKIEEVGKKEEAAAMGRATAELNL